MARRVSVEIVGDAASLERAFGRAKASATGFNATIGRLSIGFGQLAKTVLVVDAVQAALRGLTDTVHLGIGEFKEQQVLAAQTGAALKSTGGIAGVTSKHIDTLALSLSNLSGIDDEVVKAGENVLLSFTNIRDSAGKGNEIFDRATKAVADFAARTGRDLPSAAVIIGRALEDPAQRAASLSRAGVVLSKAQLTALKALERSQGILAAQKLLLKDLEVRFVGAAKAAGQTLPGQLNILRDRFKDLAGAGIGLIAPATTKAVSGLTNFVRKLSEATGARAKLRIVVTGFESLGRDIANAVERQIDRIDFRGIETRIREKIQSINWRAAVGRAGHAVGAALVDALNGLTRFLGRVDWNRVGKAIVDGIGLAVAAVVKFLAGVNWGHVAGALVRALAAAVRAEAALFIGIGAETARLILAGLDKGLTHAFAALERFALKVALAIVKPFSHLPDWLGGGPFKKMKAGLEQTLADMAQAGAKGGRTVGEAIAKGIAAGAITVGPHATPFAQVVPTVADISGQVARNVTERAGSVALQPAGPDLLGQARKRRGVTQTQRNTWFDNAISRMLDRVQDIPQLKGQIAKLQQIGGLVSERLAKTKDVTRRLTLEDKALEIARQIKGIRDQLGQNFLDALQFKLTKAQATKSQQDDLAALDTLEKGVRQRIKVEGRTLALEQQLFDIGQQRIAANQQIAQNRVDARNALQFKKLGFTGTGEDVIPGVKGLKRQLGTITDAVTGSFLDTKKTRSVLQHIRQVLAGGLGVVGREVREKVRQILDDLDKQLKSHEGDVTKFRHVSTAHLLAGLGLNSEQLRAARARFAQVGPGGTVPQGQPAFALAGGVTINGGLHLHGVQNPAQLQDEFEKLSRRRPQVRRGAR